MAGLFGSLFGGGSQQSAAAGQAFNQAGAADTNLLNVTSPGLQTGESVLTTAANKGLDPTAYTSAMERTKSATDQNIATARNAIGYGAPNIRGTTGDMFTQGINAEAGTAAQLAGENQMFKTQAASDLASIGTQASEAAASNLTTIGGDYQQAAQASGNPFMNFLNLLTGMGPGGSTANGGQSFLDMIMGLFTGGGSAATIADTLGIGGGSAAAVAGAGGDAAAEAALSAL